MTLIESLLGIIIATATIITSAALGVRWLTKHYFDEIKAELKPNGGSSIKDQVNRLELQHEKLEAKVDKIYDAIIENGIKSSSKKSK
jgi:hypothetical protein